MADNISKLKKHDTVGAVATAGTLGATWGTMGAVLLASIVIGLILLFAKK